jgi:hypothetical protein
VLLVVVEDLLHALHARVRRAVVLCVRVLLLVPVEDLRRAREHYVKLGRAGGTHAADERRDQGDARLSARDGLTEAEEEREVAVDALALELARGLDALPRRGDLDQHALLLDADALVERDERLGLGDRAGLVEGEARVDLGRDAAGDDLEDLRAEVHELPAVG